MNNQGPYSVEHDKLDEVLLAVSRKTSAPPAFSSSRRQITLISLSEPRPDFRKHFRQFQLYVRSRFAIRMIVIGGGFGCIRITVDLDTNDDEAVKDFLRALKHNDAGIRAAIKAMHMSHVEDDAINERIDLSGGTSYAITSGQKSGEPAPRLNTISDLVVHISNQLAALERHLNQFGPAGEDLSIQFRNTLEQLLPALSPEPVKHLFNEDAWRHLRHLGERIRTLKAASTEAGLASEKILGAVEKCKELKFPSNL